MELKMINVSDVQVHELNPRKTIKSAYKRLVEDIKNNKDRNLIKSAIWVVGLQKGGYRLMDGHHRLKAYKEAGIKECPALIVAEQDYDEKEQLADLITMNKQVASFDTYKLGDVIEAIKSKGLETAEIEEKLGYKNGEIDKLLNLVSVDFDAIERVRADKDDKKGDQGLPGEPGDSSQNEYGKEKVDFMLTDEQIMLVDQAISKVLDEDPNMSRGRALELICADYEAGVL